MIDLSTDVVVEVDLGDGWQPFDSCQLLEVTIERGADLVAGSGFAAADAGQLTVLTTDTDADPYRNAAMVPGVPIRVNATLAALNATAFILDESKLNVGRLGYSEALQDTAALFVGNLRSITSAYGPGGSSTTTIVATDLIDQLSNVQTYRLDPESYATRLQAIADEMGVELTVVGGDGVQLAPRWSFSSAWELMTLAANSEAGFIYSTRNGELEARTRGAYITEPLLELSDVHDDTNPRHACYIGITADTDSARIVNTVTMSNIAYQALSDGEDMSQELDPYIDTESVAAYGPATLALSTNLPKAEDGSIPAADDLAEYVFGRLAQPRPTVSLVDYIPENIAQTLLDVGQYVTVQLADVIDGAYMVSRIVHTLSGDSGWTTTLGLWKVGDQRWL